MWILQPRSCFILLTLILAPAPPAESETASRDWPRYRGPDVSGVAKATDVFTGAGAPGLRLTWRTPLGSGYSGIAIAAQVAITLFADDATGQDVMAAFDTSSGQRLWTYPIDRINPGRDGSHDGPLATPLIEDRRVFGIGPWGQLFALDARTGKELWLTHLVDDHGIALPMYGFGSSPIIEDGVLLVPLGGEGSALGGFDPATGEMKWKSGNDQVFYHTPVPMNLHGRRQILAAGAGKLLALDARHGEVLWEWSHGGGGARGAVSLVPMPVSDGRIFLAHQDDSSILIEPGPDGQVRTVWEGRAIRNSYNIPVEFQGHLYTFSSRFLTCVDARTGEARWRSRAPGDGFLILVDGHLVIQTKKGGVHLAPASPDGFREVASLEVFADTSWTLPSFAGGAIYVRGFGEIARLDVTFETSESRQEAGSHEKPAATRPADEASAFARFLAEVEAAEGAEKDTRIDQFLSSQRVFPIVEQTPGENLSQVHFVYRGRGQDLALAGDLFGGRVERPMVRLPGTNFFYYSFEAPADARLNYVFIRDYEIILDPRNTRSETVSYYGVDMEVAFSGDGLPMSWFSMPNWRQPEHLEEAPASSRGRVEAHRFKSQVSGEKIGLQVYVPVGYDKGTKNYPVAYVHRGDEALQQGRVPNSLDNLIGHRVAPVLVVFMDPRPQNLMFAATWFEGFDQALAEEIVPFIDRKYRTIRAPEGRANVGAGFPAFYATVATLRHPDIFGKLATQSLFLTEAFFPLLDPWLQQAPKNPPVIYMDWGLYDLRSAHEPIDMTITIPQRFQQLKELGYNVVGGQVNDGIGWSSWRQRTDRVYEALFPLGVAP